MTCVNPRCYGIAHYGNLCTTCRDLRDSAIVVSVCVGMVALIVAMAKLGAML